MMFFFFLLRPPPSSTLFPYTTLFRSSRSFGGVNGKSLTRRIDSLSPGLTSKVGPRSEEHTSELQSLTNLVCRLLLEKKKTIRSGRSTRTKGASGNHPAESFVLVTLRD